MKLFLLAATVAFAVPVMAQDTTADPAQTDSSMPAQDQSQDQSTMPQDQSNMGTQDQSGTDTQDQSSMGSQDQSSMGSQGQSGMGTPNDANSTPMGGYQPSTPPMSSPMQPGATVQFHQSASPSQAFPAPAPMANYPTCKRGQTDHCMEPHSMK